MSNSHDRSGVPSGFFAQTAATNSFSQHRGVPAAGMTSVSQQRGHFHNYGQPTNVYAYHASPQRQSQTYAFPAPPSRKRAREEIMFRCEPCDLELGSEVALESHKKSHVKCSACDFEGAPKVVKGHFQSVHGKFSGSGFKTVTVAIPGCPVQRFRICVGNRPEDVQRWIEERKKRFPRSRPVRSDPKVEPKAGLSTLLDGYSSSEDENDPKPPTESPHAADLLAPVNSSEVKSSTPQKKPCHSFVRHGSCRRGDACPYSHDQSLRKPKQPGRKQNHKTKRDLLSNLLESDADRETKLSLQLIHYLVQSDFLRKRV